MSSNAPPPPSGGESPAAPAATRAASSPPPIEERLVASTREVAQLKAAIDEHAIVAITDASGHITYANDRFCAISQYSREELLGQNHRLVNSRLHPPEFFRDLWRTISNGQVWHGEIRNQAKDGSHYWVETTIVPFLDAHGKPREYVAIRTDITRLKNAEAALQRRTEDLSRSNDDLERFAYIASHDLQEPLRGIAGCLQLLQQRYRAQIDERADEFITHAVDGAMRMQRMIEDLLAFSRISTRNLRRRRVGIDQVVDTALANLRTALQESGATIERGTLPELLCDPSLLSQLFQNLVGNALKFRGQAPPLIRISATPEPEAWQFAIQDNGIGIEPQHFHRLFRIFQRLHTRREYPGTGIGLAICHRIVERHGGRIWIESAPGAGSTFRFTLLDKDVAAHAPPQS